MFILASCAVTFLNPRPQFSVFMLGCVNKVLPWDKWLHKLIAHKGQLGFYEKHESENCCWCSCMQFSTASQSIIFERRAMWTGAWRCNVTMPVAWQLSVVYHCLPQHLQRCPELLKGTKTTSLLHSLKEKISRQYFDSIFAEAGFSQQNSQIILPKK